MNKVLKFLKKFFVGIIVVVFFAFVISMTVMMWSKNEYGVTEIGDNAFILIAEDLSTGKYKKGDLVIVEKTKLSKLDVGDEVFVYIVNDDQISIDYGKIGVKYDSDNALAFENGSIYDIKYVAGVEKTVYSGIGTVLSVIQSQIGFLFIVLIPCLLVFIYELYALIVEIKYGSENE